MSPDKFDFPLVYFDAPRSIRERRANEALMETVESIYKLEDKRGLTRNTLLRQMVSKGTFNTLVVAGVADNDPIR